MTDWFNDRRCRLRVSGCLCIAKPTPPNGSTISNPPDHDPDATIQADLGTGCEPSDHDPDATIQADLGTAKPHHDPDATRQADLGANSAGTADHDPDATIQSDLGSRPDAPTVLMAEGEQKQAADNAAGHASGPKLIKDVDGLKQIDNYEIVKFLGEGGMGTVFQARHKDLGRITAMKVIHLSQTTAATADQFLREARLAAAVEHPNLVTIYDFGQVDDLLFMAMRYVDGGDVDQKLKREGILGQGAAIGIMLDCARALDAIYRSGMIHRDIKPGNIFLDQTGAAYIGDLGLACLVTDKSLQQGGFAGTPAFASPEQAQMEAVDIRSDIYSLGGVLYAMTTACRPFEGKTPFEVLGKVLSAPTPDPREINPNLDERAAAIVMRAMAKDRDLRYATPTELLEDLLALADNKPLVHTKPAPVGYQPSPTTERYSAQIEQSAIHRAREERKVTVLRQSGYQFDGIAEETEQQQPGFLKRILGSLFKK